jgi:hypothetical protein
MQITHVWQQNIPSQTSISLSQVNLTWNQMHQNAGENYNIKIGNRSFENAAKLRYLGATSTNKKLHSQKIFLSSCMLSKNINTKIIEIS